MKKTQQPIHPGMYVIVIVIGFILVSTLAFAAHFEDRDANSFYAEQVYGDFEKNYAGKTVELPFAAEGYSGVAPFAQTFNQSVQNSVNLIKARYGNARMIMAGLGPNSQFDDLASINCAPEH